MADLKAILEQHMRRYPAMEAPDAVKLIFQAMLGCGHLLAEESAVIHRVEAEEAELIPCADEPLTESLGPRYARLNLRRAMAEGIRPEWIARMMQLCQAHPDRQEAVKALLATAEQLSIPSWAEEMRRTAQRIADEPNWLPSHSAAYHAAYAPAYRVIPAEAVRLLPVLSAMAAQWDKPRILAAIDGPCGSGKTTLARLLCSVTDAAVVHMDDFFLPHAQKTAERLNQPGGNADWERFISEFLLPWLDAGQASYRPYDCHANAYAQPVDVPPRKVTVIEGSYCLMPEIARHVDLRVFLTIDPEEQKRRILKRSGEAMLQRFIQQWIPLEKAYFAAYGLPDAGCVLPDVQSVQDV